MKKIYRCMICSSHTTALHEVIFGRGYREISIKASIQAPLCQKCHEAAHGKKSKNFKNYDNFDSWDFAQQNQEQIKKQLSFNLCFNYDKMIYLFNQLTGIMSKEAMKHIMAGKNEREKIIKRYEI